MEHISVPAAVAFLGWFIGSVVWAVRLEGRVNLVEKVLEDTREQSHDLFDRVLSQLDRIERNMVSIKVTCAAFNHKHGLEEVVEPPK